MTNYQILLTASGRLKTPNLKWVCPGNTKGSECHRKRNQPAAIETRIENEFLTGHSRSTEVHITSSFNGNADLDAPPSTIQPHLSPQPQQISVPEWQWFPPVRSPWQYSYNPPFPPANSPWQHSYNPPCSPSLTRPALSSPARFSTPYASSLPYTCRPSTLHISSSEPLFFV